MLTLNAVKSETGIATTNTGDDADLLRVIRQVVSRIRQRTDRGIAWVTDSVKASGTAAIVRVIGHGWRTGQIISVAGSNSTPTIDGERTITRVDEDTISIPSVTITTEGTFATLHPKLTKEICAASAVRLWIPEQITPFLSVEAIYDRLDDDTWELVDDADYEITDDTTVEKAIQVNRITGSFPRSVQYPRGQYALRERSRKTTVKVIVWAGTPVLPEEIVMAGLSMVNDMWERAGRGKDEASFSYEGTSRSSMTGDERKEHLLSPESILASWQAR